MKFKSNKFFLYSILASIFNKKFIQVELSEKKISLIWNKIKKNIKWTDVKSLKINKYANPVSYSLKLKWDKNTYIFMFYSSIGISMPWNIWIVGYDISKIWDFIEAKKFKYNI
jgi:hypothetical protein